MQTARDDVIYALRIYNDIPAMIAEEWATIRNCEEQRDKVGVTAAKLREVAVENGGKHGDKTARLATEDKDALFQQEIDARLAHIDEQRRTREWLRRGLACIGEEDRYYNFNPRLHRPYRCRTAPQMAGKGLKGNIYLCRAFSILRPP